ncbi:hypothetical protein P153DRAFT_40836 [Dothidotthia symphoricarpi CBS 119687]|uniref:Uncharacterized protein n=1 Tax=Dothidotthia symphoricarpi CBS 119687 TaxID=1392245 RepID=A0A6A6A9F5_9PLEO|nr:uncharacterized protein P153DRAFT_40836 [Dothidotthia symphoricarpi CBS 119687]KAF2128592.1 hypothetical protein P153DRAFT_40836 [Dothidotthia symphoricarpi CBS 119687]
MSVRPPLSPSFRISSRLSMPILRSKIRHSSRPTTVSCTVCVMWASVAFENLALYSLGVLDVLAIKTLRIALPHISRHDAYLEWRVNSCHLRLMHNNDHASERNGIIAISLIVLLLLSFWSCQCLYGHRSQKAINDGGIRLFRMRRRRQRGCGVRNAPRPGCNMPL